MRVRMRMIIAVAAALLLAGIAGYFWQAASPDSAGHGFTDDGLEAAGRASKSPRHQPVGTDWALWQTATLDDDDPVGTLRLEGQVIDLDEHGVAGAVVTIGSNPPRTATSESDGSFVVEKLIARQYRVTAVAGDLVGTQLHELTPDSEPLIIRVREGSRLEITVVDAESSEPIEGATVEVRGVRELVETSDDTGTATFRGVPSGLAALYAHAEGHAPANSLTQVPETPGGAVKQTIALERGAPVSGRVVDADGLPVADARVMARPAGEFLSTGNSWKDGVATNAEGRFRLPAVSAGTWRITADHRSYPRASSEAMSLDGVTEHDGVVIEMQTGVVLAGRVVNRVGKPAPWATVRVGPKHGSEWSGGWDGVRRAVTKEDGTFRFEAMRPEVVIAVASAEHVSSDSLEIDLRARGSVDDALLELSLEGRISGVVVDSEGSPVPEATVSATPDGVGESMSDWAIRGVTSVITDGDGAFTFGGLRGGSYRLRANRSALDIDWHRLRSSVEARTGDANVKIVLDPEAGLTGVLAFQDASHPEWFTVQIGYATPIPGGTKGRFEVDGVPGGTYDITFRGPDFATRTVRDVRVEGGDLVDMGTVEVLRGRAVFGRVIGPDGDGVAGASVLAARQLFGDGTTLGAGHGARVDDLVGMRRATTDPVGGFRITGISHREGVIAAEHAAIGRSKFVSIAAGDQNAHIDLSLVAFGRLAGTVTAGGAPATRATISAAQSGTQNPAFVVTDADGTYVFPKLPAGDYQVSALIQEGVSSGMREARQVTVAAGKDTTLDIDVDVDAGTITLVVKIVPEGSDQIAWAQVLLANAQVSADNGKQLNEAFLGGNAADGQWATAADGKQATFERLTPATYSACVIPMAGSVNDPAIHERVQRCREHVKVYCERVTVNDAPERQSYTATVPAMRDPPDCDH